MSQPEATARRVLFLAWQGARAGIERHLSTLIYALPACIEKAVVFLSRGGPVAEELAASGIPVHVLGMRRSYDLAGARRLLRLVRDGRFALVHDHSTMAAAPILVLGWAGVPLVVTEHLSQAQRRLDQRLSYRLLSRFVDAFVANSMSTRQELVAQGISTDKVRVIYHGLVPRERISRDDARAALAPKVPVLRAESQEICRPFLVGFVGRLEREKGCRQFVVVAERVAGAVPEARFVMVGTGSQRSLVAADITAAGLDDRFQMVGELPNVEHVYPAFDVFVSCSERETFGLAVLEAMSAGVPVAAFRVGGVGELIAAGAGESVAKGDVEGLADAVIGLLRNPQQREELGARAHDRVADRFAAARMASEVVELYDRVWAQRALR